MTAAARHTTSGTWILLAVGGTLVAAIAYLFVPRGSRTTDAMSLSTQGTPIESRVPETLPRDHVVLRWTPTAGATYSVSVTDERGAVLHNARELRQAEYEVPAAAFGGLAPNTRVVWRVGANLPNRSRITSKEFHVLIR